MFSNTRETWSVDGASAGIGIVADAASGPACAVDDASDVSTLTATAAAVVASVAAARSSLTDAHCKTTTE